MPSALRLMHSTTKGINSNSSNSCYKKLYLKIVSNLWYRYQQLIYLFMVLFLFIELNKHKRQHTSFISLRRFEIRLIQRELSTSQPNLDNFTEVVCFTHLLGYLTEKTNEMLVSYSLYLVGSACIPYLFIFYSSVSNRTPLYFCLLLCKLIMALNCSTCCIFFLSFFFAEHFYMNVM